MVYPEADPSTVPPLGRVLLATGHYPMRLGVRGILIRRGFAIYEAPDRDTATNVLAHDLSLDALVLGSDLPPDGALPLLSSLADPPPTLLMTGEWLTPPTEVLDGYPTISAVVGRPYPLKSFLNAFHHTLARGQRQAFG